MTSGGVFCSITICTWCFLELFWFVCDLLSNCVDHQKRLLLRTHVLSAPGGPRFLASVLINAVFWLHKNEGFTSKIISVQSTYVSMRWTFKKVIKTKKTWLATLSLEVPPLIMVSLVNWKFCWISLPIDAKKSVDFFFLCKIEGGAWIWHKPKRSPKSFACRRWLGSYMR